MRLTTLAHLFHPQRSNNHRPRLLHPAAYLVYLSFGVIFLAGLRLQTLMSQGSVLGYASNITPTQVIEQTNQERRRLGLPALTYNAELNAAALKKGQDMFSQQYWAHTSPVGKEPWAFMKEAGYEYQAAGENLARDFSVTSDMVQAWMDSPTHRANVVNPKYTEIGVAVIDGTLQGYETTLVVQMFGQPSKTVARQPTVLPAAEANQVAVAPATDQAEQLVAVESRPAPVTQLVPTPTVLARALVPQGSLERSPLFSPLQLTKVFFLAVILMIILTLTYDLAVIGHRRTMRLVGHNFGHITFLIVVGFLILLFRGGIIG